MAYSVQELGRNSKLDFNQTTTTPEPVMSAIYEL